MVLLKMEKTPKQICFPPTCRKILHIGREEPLFSNQNLSKGNNKINTSISRYRYFFFFFHIIIILLNKNTSMGDTPVNYL